MKTFRITYTDATGAHQNGYLTAPNESYARAQFYDFSQYEGCRLISINEIK